MRKEELDRRCAEMKARMLAQRAASAMPSAGDRDVIQTSQSGAAQQQQPAEVAPEMFRIEKPHPLITTTKRLLKNRKGYRPLIHLGGTESVDISVGKDSVARALWFMHHVITKCGSAGTSFSVSPKYPASTSAVGKPIQVRVQEKTTRTERPPFAEGLARRVAPQK